MDQEELEGQMLDTTWRQQTNCCADSNMYHMFQIFCALSTLGACTAFWYTMDLSPRMECVGI